MRTYTVYRIYNVVDGKCYVGQTGKLKQRINVHFGALRIGKHRNRLFQSAFNQHGEQAFKVEILEENISIENADAREIFWIDQFQAYPDGYNQKRVGTQRLEGQPIEYQDLTFQMDEYFNEWRWKNSQIRQEQEKIKAIEQKIEGLKKEADKAYRVAKSLDTKRKQVLKDKKSNP